MGGLIPAPRPEAIVMAKKAAQQEETAPEAPSNGESVAGYFRRIFDENPKLLKERSNDVILQRWLADHPGHSEVPGNVKANLANLKSTLRKKTGKQGRKPRVEATSEAALSQPRARLDKRRLEELEHQIDEALQAAKATDREGLARVIQHLRAARNLVVMEVGWE
jgi:hypothetical protein